MSTQTESGFNVRYARAKINLTLEVTGKREDGFHEITSVMQALDLTDILTFRPAEHLFLDCDIAELVSPNNLVYRAAAMLQNFAGEKRGAAISIDKNIPLASGLGGGSSDAVATLHALNEIWQLSLSEGSLGNFAAMLGSDTFFFLHSGGTALAEGRGEKITPLPPLPQTWVVLMKPALNISGKTSVMYAGLDPSHFTRGEATQRGVEKIKRGEGIANSDCYNVFERVAFSRYTALQEYRRLFLSAGAEEIHLAGSGPTLFTLVKDEAQGLEICRQLVKERIEVYLAKTL